MLLKKQRANAGYYFILPTLLLLSLLFIFPLVDTFFISFFNTNLANKWNFIGFQNYVELFSDKYFWESLWVTLLFTLGAVVGHFILGIVFALLLNTRVKGRTVFRVALLLPWIVPEVVTALTWTWMYNTTYGIINHTLMAIGLINNPISWIGDPSTALLALIITVIWKGYPFVMITVLAGLQAIPLDLYEAAEIDGASGWGKFLYVTVPGLKNVVLITAILDSIWWFKHFTIIHAMTGGGPVRATEVLSISVHRNAFTNFKFGYASSLAIVIFIICITITLIYQRVLTGGDGV